MLKYFHLIAALSAASIPFIAETAFSRPLTASSRYPVVPSSDSGELFCYMQTADGRTLDLSRLCGNKPSGESQVVISEVSFVGNRMIGRVVNKTGKTVYDIEVNYEVFSKDGTWIGRRSIYLNPVALGANQATTFRTILPSSSKVRTTSVEWNE
jgi:hypothetical protein